MKIWFFKKQSDMTGLHINFEILKKKLSKRCLVFFHSRNCKRSFQWHESNWRFKRSMFWFFGISWKLIITTLNTLISNYFSVSIALLLTSNIRSAIKFSLSSYDNYCSISIIPLAIFLLWFGHRLADSNQWVIANYDVCAECASSLPKVSPSLTA